MTTRFLGAKLLKVLRRKEKSVGGEEANGVGGTKSDVAERPDRGETGFGIQESPSNIFAQRIARYKDQSGLDAVKEGGQDGPVRRYPTRAVGYESEASALDKEESRLIQVARLANRGARGSAEASEELQDVLRSQLSDIHAEIDSLYRELNLTAASVKKLPYRSNVDMTEFELPRSDFETVNEEDEQHYFRTLDFEISIWELEAMITEHCYKEAVSIVENLKASSREIFDDLLLTRFESATEILCKELQPVEGTPQGSASNCSQLLARLNRSAEARNVLLDDMSRNLHVKLRSVQRGGPPISVLQSVCRELFEQLCDALYQYRKLTESDPTALPVFMAWFVIEIDTVYEELMRPQMRALKDIKALPEVISTMLSIGDSSYASEEDNIESIYAVRLSEMLRVDVGRLLSQETSRVIDKVNLALRNESWELIEVSMDEIIEIQVVDVISEKRIALANSCRVLCLNLKEILQIMGSFQLEGIYSDLVNILCKTLETYAKELSRHKKHEQVKTNFVVLASVFLPYATAALEETVNCAVPELDNLRTRFLAQAGLLAEETVPVLVTRRQSDVGLHWVESISRWKPMRIELSSLERELSRKSAEDPVSATSHETMQRERLRQKMLQQRSQKGFV